METSDSDPQLPILPDPEAVTGGEPMRPLIRAGAAEALRAARLEVLEVYRGADGPRQAAICSVIPRLRPAHVAVVEADAVVAVFPARRAVSEDEQLAVPESRRLLADRWALYGTVEGLFRVDLHAAAEEPGFLADLHPPECGLKGLDVDPTGRFALVAGTDLLGGGVRLTVFDSAAGAGFAVDASALDGRGWAFRFRWDGSTGAVRFVGGSAGEEFRIALDWSARRLSGEPAPVGHG